jgi:hypothetical protein
MEERVLIISININTAGWIIECASFSARKVTKSQRHARRTTITELEPSARDGRPPAAAGDLPPPPRELRAGVHAVAVQVAFVKSKGVRPGYPFPGLRVETRRLQAPWVNRVQLAPPHHAAGEHPG